MFTCGCVVMGGVGVDDPHLVAFGIQTPGQEPPAFVLFELQNVDAAGRGHGGLHLCFRIAGPRVDRPPRLSPGNFAPGINGCLRFCFKAVPRGGDGEIAGGQRLHDGLITGRELCRHGTVNAPRRSPNRMAILADQDQRMRISHHHAESVGRKVDGRNFLRASHPVSRSRFHREGVGGGAGRPQALAQHRDSRFRGLAVR